MAEIKQEPLVGIQLPFANSISIHTEPRLHLTAQRSHFKFTKNERNRK